MNKKIIHLVLGKANPERMNGVNKVAHALASTQHDFGYEVELWGITKNMAHDYPERNYHTRLFPKMGFPFVLNQLLVNAINKLDKNTVFHIHGAFISEFYSVARLLHRNGITFVYTSHGGFNKEAINRNLFIKKTYYHLFEKRILKWAHKIHFIGASEMENAQEFSQKNILIPNGQRVDDLTFTYRQVLTEELPVFGYCGRLALKEKGIDILLEGFSLYKTAGGKGELWMIGDGPDKDEIQKLTQRLDLGHAVKYFGSQYGGEKLNLIVNMDWFVLTSRNEGLPTSVLEAAALRIPCIISKETNLGGKVKTFKAGIVLDENLPFDLCKAFIEASYLLREQRQMGLNAHLMVVQEFNWQTIAQQLVDHYHENNS